MTLFSFLSFLAGVLVLVVVLFGVYVVNCLLNDVDEFYDSRGDDG